ncbi:PAS domain-containing protein [Flavobacterium taihuense]|uniref:PAS domain-containing protein n=1 Tax=Flavobacterium taihuense TaxID=2857508 RepID=A0ABS6XQX6_9FLAO|nr:PAS domain-containing protein [Flavobacterium taihuense]MBW4359078.1 PAS domain-containing protein [Flavobacterium taihuense]
MATLIDGNNAKAKYFSSSKWNAIPIISWGFSNSFQKQIKNIVLDTHKILNLSHEQKWESTNWDFKNKLKEKVILITDAKQQIVFASHNMQQMNGYAEKEVLGQSPKMFQGKETILETSIEIREAISLQKPFVKQVLNYKKNGELYYCNIEGFPIFNKKGKLVNFIAFEQAA